MKRVAEYLTLAAVLVGLPLGCAWIGGYHDVLADVAEIAPKCEEWVNDPLDRRAADSAAVTSALRSRSRTDNGRGTTPEPPKDAGWVARRAENLV